MIIKQTLILEFCSPNRKKTLSIFGVIRVLRDLIYLLNGYSKISISRLFSLLSLLAVTRSSLDKKTHEVF